MIEAGSAGLNGAEAPRDVGVICITEEDAHQWEEVLEDEEESWDDEDGDSNGMSDFCSWLSCSRFPISATNLRYS